MVSGSDRLAAQAALDPGADVGGRGGGVDVVEEGAPAAGTREGVQPPGAGDVAGAGGAVWPCGVDVEGDEDARGLGKAGDPLEAAGAGGGTGGDGDDEIAGGLDDGEGVEFAFDENGGEGVRRVGAESAGVVEGVGEAARAEVLGLAAGDLRGAERAADVEAPNPRPARIVDVPGEGDAAGKPDPAVRIGGRREAPGDGVVVEVFRVVADVEGAEGGVLDAAGAEVGEGTGAFVFPEEEGTAGGEFGWRGFARG